MLWSAAGSHVGRVREINEDSWLADPPVFLVADGMGGHDAGDVASRLVVEAFAPLAGSGSIGRADVEACLRAGATAVAALADEHGAAPGSTVVIAAYIVEADHGHWLVANIGDSRAYAWSSAGLEQISHDHSIVQELIDSGEIDEAEARIHPDRHVITRAIGALEVSPAEYALIPISGDSRLLLCSDGVTGELSDESIAEILASTPNTTEAVARIIDDAVAAGGHDNVTAVLVDVQTSAQDLREDTLGSPLEDFLVSDTIRTRRR